MEPKKQELRERYEAIETEELIVLYKKSGLTEFASPVLVQILEERGVSPETLNESTFMEDAKEPTKCPSLKSIVLAVLIYLFGSTTLNFVFEVLIGLIGGVIGIPSEKLISISIVIVMFRVVSFFFYLFITVFLVKRYSGYIFSGSWKTNFYSRLETGLKWSIPFIYFAGLAASSPEGRDAMLKAYLLFTALSLENITIKTVILISAWLLNATFLEEIIFRGMIQQYIKKFITPRISVLITAGIFTIVHLDNFFFIPMSLRAVVNWFVLGILTGFAFNKHNSCISSFIPHLVFNLKGIIIVPLMLTF